jgi:hypothetical protein
VPAPSTGPSATARCGEPLRWTDGRAPIRVSVEPEAESQVLRQWSRFSPRTLSESEVIRPAQVPVQINETATLRSYEPLPERPDASETLLRDRLLARGIGSSEHSGSTDVAEIATPWRLPPGQAAIQAISSLTRAANSLRAEQWFRRFVSDNSLPVLESAGRAARVPPWYLDRFNFRTQAMELLDESIQAVEITRAFCT